jgi:hypothetical protein
LRITSHALDQMNRQLAARGRPEPERSGTTTSPHSTR